MHGVLGHYSVQAARHHIWGVWLVYGEVFTRGVAKVDKISHVASGTYHADGGGHV